LITLLRIRGNVVYNYIRRGDRIGTVLGEPACVVPMSVMHHRAERLNPVLWTKPLNQTVLFSVSYIVEKPRQSSTSSQNVKFLEEIWNGQGIRMFLLISICLHVPQSLFFCRTTSRGNFFELLMKFNKII